MKGAQGLYKAHAFRRDDQGTLYHTGSTDILNHPGSSPLEPAPQGDTDVRH